MARDSCLNRVVAGVAVGGAVGGAVGKPPVILYYASLSSTL